MRLPERILASATMTPRHSPAMIRLRAGRVKFQGSSPGPLLAKYQMVIANVFLQTFYWLGDKKHPILFQSLQLFFLHSGVQPYGQPVSIPLAKPLTTINSFSKP